jgi:cytochrome P450
MPLPPPSAFFGAAFVADPFPLFAQARAAGPLTPLPGAFSLPGQTVWLVTRWEEAVQALKDDARFTVDPSRIGAGAPRMQRPESGRAGRGFFGGRSMISVDEPDHRRLRSLVSRAFTPRYIESLRPRVEALADALLDRVQPQGAMDLVADFAYPLPINVISDMLGVPAGERDQLRAWSEAIAGGAAGAADPARFAKLSAFGEYTARLVAEKRRRPQDDLVSQLAQIEEAGDRLDEDELLAMVGLLIFAGHETTSNLIGNGALALLDHPAQMARLHADPGLIPQAVEELLRYCAPVMSPAPRFATEDTTLGGQPVRRGDALMVVLASADRDAAQFRDPEDLEIARALNRHIAFGQGIHFCLGAPLARLEGQIAFATLLRRLPDLRLAIPRADVRWRGGLNLRGLAALPVAF